MMVSMLMLRRVDGALGLRLQHRAMLNTIFSEKYVASRSLIEEKVSKRDRGGRPTASQLTGRARPTSTLSVEPSRGLEHCSIYFE